MGLGSQRIQTVISVGTCFVHYPYRVFIMGLNNELAKYNVDTKLVCQSKQMLVVTLKVFTTILTEKALKF